jgi:hypothetical protein
VSPRIIVTARQRDSASSAFWHRSAASLSSITSSVIGKDGFLLRELTLEYSLAAADSPIASTMCEDGHPRGCAT